MTLPAAHMAAVDVPFDLLSDLLQLPPGVRVVGAHWDVSMDGLRLKVEGQGLPLVRSGEMLQTIRPTLHPSAPRLAWPLLPRLGAID